MNNMVVPVFVFNLKGIHATLYYSFINLHFSANNVQLFPFLYIFNSSYHLCSRSYSSRSEDKWHVSLICFYLKLIVLSTIHKPLDIYMHSFENFTKI